MLLTLSFNKMFLDSCDSLAANVDYLQPVIGCRGPIFPYPSVLKRQDPWLKHIKRLPNIFIALLVGRISSNLVKSNVIIFISK